MVEIIKNKAQTVRYEITIEQTYIFVYGTKESYVHITNYCATMKEEFGIRLKIRNHFSNWRK